MQTLERPPKMNVLLLIFLGFVTFAIFLPIWFLMRKDWLNRLSATNKLGSGLAIFVLVIYGISFFMFIMTLGTEFEGFWDAIDGLITIVGGICLIILAFKVRRILIQHYDENLGMNIGFSGVATFFLGEWYLQYKINRLPVSDSLDLAESRVQSNTG